jgi:hypothetical protein
MTPDYRNGKIAGMMIAARVVQEMHEKVGAAKITGYDLRVALGKECGRQRLRHVGLSSR